MRTRSLLAWIIGVTVLAAGCGSGAGSAALTSAVPKPEEPDITVAAIPAVDLAGLYIAQDRGLFARQGLRMPAFLKYDQTTSGQFRISKKKSVGLWNQNTLLATYPGAIGGKIGWTSAAGATYVGMARRHGVTLIVSLLHCPALTEITAGKSLLNWGFAVDGKVRPVGTLVGPLPPPAPTPATSRPAAAGQPADRAQSVGSGPSVLVTAGFSGVALLAAGIGFAYSRRQRSAARR